MFSIEKRILTLLAAVLLSAVAARPATASEFQVVVNSSNPNSSVSKDQLAKFFLKKATKWDHGLKVQPVDQAAKRTLRRSFSKVILGKEVSWIKSYWQKLIFSGRATPPPELDSDQDVLDYVRNKSGGIGYVSAGASVGSGVKVLRVRD